LSSTDPVSRCFQLLCKLFNYKELFILYILYKISDEIPFQDCLPKLFKWLLFAQQQTYLKFISKFLPEL